MPYIGNDLATQFQAFATQTITGDGSTGYTLDRAVANGKELLVYINNVKQEEGSGKSYEASGTTITFSEAVASGDSCYLVYMGSAQQTVTAPDGSIVSGQIANATLALPSGLTVVGNTGIGTTSPSTALHIKDSDGGILQTVETGDSGNAYLKFINSTTGSGAFSDGFLVGLDTDESATFWLYEGNHMKFATSGTEALRIDANGHITKPLQSAFSVTESGSQANIATQSTVDLLFDTEVFDVNGDFASSTFTAPVTGKYVLCGNITISNMDQDADFTSVTIDTSNRNYSNIIDPEGFDKDLSYFSFTITVVADMDASDTAKMTFYQSAGSAVADLAVGQSYFSGYLLG